MLAVLLLLSLFGFARGEEPACSRLRSYVYRIRLDQAHYGAGFFLSPAGEFLTALHVLKEAPGARAASVAVGAKDYPVTSVLAFSRELDFAIVQVRLDRGAAEVPPLARSIAPGAAVIGFRVGAPPPVKYRSANPVSCTRGKVSAVSSKEIAIQGGSFLRPRFKRLAGFRLGRSSGFDRGRDGELEAGRPEDLHEPAGRSGGGRSAIASPHPAV